MDAMERRVFLKGAGMGLLAFSVGGADVMMTPGQARAQGVPFRLLKAPEAEALEALGETLVPGARQSGVAHFIDQQVSVPPGTTFQPLALSTASALLTEYGYGPPDFSSGEAHCWP